MLTFIRQRTSNPPVSTNPPREHPISHLDFLRCYHCKITQDAYIFSVTCLQKERYDNFESFNYSIFGKVSLYHTLTLRQISNIREIWKPFHFTRLTRNRKRDESGRSESNYSRNDWRHHVFTLLSVSPRSRPSSSIRRRFQSETPFVFPPGAPLFLISSSNDVGKRTGEKTGLDKFGCGSWWPATWLSLPNSYPRLMADFVHVKTIISLRLV